jgi:polyhydroxybutyrate depolymerase
MQNRDRVAVACLATTLLLVGCGGINGPTAAPSAPAATPTPVVPAVTAERTTARIRVGTEILHYAVVEPSDASTRGPLPLLLVLHGPNVSTAEMESISGVDTLAVEPGAVLVFPDPWATGWGPRPSDVALIANLVSLVEARYPIDPNRAFIAGDGVGGSAAYRVACEMAGRFAAVAVVSGPLLVDCNPLSPISVLHIHGTADTVFPYDGGGTGCGEPCPSVGQTMERWRQADDCTGEPTTTTEGIVTTSTYATCAGGAEVEFIKVAGLDDTWLGPGIDDLAVIWGFLMDHGGPPGAAS